MKYHLKVIMLDYESINSAIVGIKKALELNLLTDITKSIERDKKISDLGI